MCEELKLIQTHLGIWDVRKWDLNTAIRQFGNLKGLYLIKCKQNGKLLIGEGSLGNNDQCSRIGAHIRGNTSNSGFKSDLKLYGKEQFELYGFIIENDEQTRRNIEYALHIHFKDMCYNMSRAPVWMIYKLYEEGKTKKEIAKILQCSERHVYVYIKTKLTSKYIGVYFNSLNYEARYYGADKANLGHYASEEEAAQNRDYYIVKNNLMNKQSLNFHDIDYINFTPHKTTNGQVNKHLL